MYKKQTLMYKTGVDDVIVDLASEIVKTSEGGPIDVVFVVDVSASMDDNLRAIGQHLNDMIHVYQSAKIDYALGLTTFGVLKGNVIKVCQLTTDLGEYQQEILSLRPISDRGQNAPDAID